MNTNDLPIIHDPPEYEPPSVTTFYEEEILEELGPAQAGVSGIGPE